MTASLTPPAFGVDEPPVCVDCVFWIGAQREGAPGDPSFTSNATQARPPASVKVNAPPRARAGTRSGARPAADCFVAGHLPAMCGRFGFEQADE